MSARAHCLAILLPAVLALACAPVREKTVYVQEAAASTTQAASTNAPGNTNPPGNTPAAVTLSASLEARGAAGPQTSFQVGQSLRFALVLANPATREQVLDFPTAQQFEITVSQSGQTVWSYGAAGNTGGQPTTLRIAAGARVELTTSYDLKDQSGRALAAGDYDVAASLTSHTGPQATAIAPLKLTIAAPTPIGGGLVVQLEVRDAAGQPRTSFQTGEAVDIQLSVTNTGTQSETLEFRTPLRDTIRVEDQAGTMIWDPRFGLRLAPPIPGWMTTETLAPGKRLSFQASWDQKDSQTRAQVAAGSYQATGKINATVRGGTALAAATPRTFTITAPRPAGWQTALRVLDVAGQPQSGFALGEVLRLELDITNASAQAAKLTAPDGLGLAGFRIRQGQTMVRDSLAGRFGIMILIDVPFGAGETKTFRFDWDQRDDQGQAVAAGAYQVEARVRDVSMMKPLQPAPAAITLGASRAKDTVVISGVATNSGIVASRIGFIVGVQGVAALAPRVEVGASRGQTALDTARALAAALPGSYMGVVTSLANGDAELQVQPGPNVLLSGPIELSDVRSNDPVQRIRLK